MKKNMFLFLGAIAMAAGIGAGIARFSQTVPVPTHALTDSEQKDSVYLRGSFNGWSDADNYKLTYIGETKDGESDVAHFVITLKLTANDEFKVCYKTSDTQYRWCNAIYDNAICKVKDENNIQVQSGKTGYYTLHFRTNFADSVNYIFDIEEVDQSATRTVYFVNGPEWGTVKCHHWNNDDGTSWAGDTMTATDFKLKCKVKGVQKNAISIYKLTIPTRHNFLIFNNNSGTQTANLHAEDDGIYFYDIDAGKYNPIVKLLLQVDGAMKNGSYDGRSYTKTICGMTNDAAASIKTAYNALNTSGDAEVVTSIEGSTLVTNDYTKADGNTATVTLKNVYDVLSYSYPKVGTGALSVKAAGKDNGTAITAGLAGLGVAAAGAMIFFAKRRKEI